MTCKFSPYRLTFPIQVELQKINCKKTGCGMMSGTCRSLDTHNTDRRWSNLRVWRILQYLGSTEQVKSERLILVSGTVLCVTPTQCYLKMIINKYNILFIVSSAPGSWLFLSCLNIRHEAWWFLGMKLCDLGATAPKHFFFWSIRSIFFPSFNILGFFLPFL